MKAKRKKIYSITINSALQDYTKDNNFLADYYYDDDDEGALHKQNELNDMHLYCLYHYLHYSTISIVSHYSTECLKLR